MQNPLATNYFVYAGTYGEGVYAFRFDPQAGTLEPIGLVGTIENPSYLTTDRDYRYLYAVSELMGDAEGAVGAFKIDRNKGKLDFLNSAPSGGVAPCHLTVDDTGNVLLVANYVTGSVSSYPIQDGRIGKMSSLMTAEGVGVNPARQEGPHAHYVVIGADHLVYVVDLGLDRIRLYRLNSADATLAPNNPPFNQVEGGLGPRHFVFSPDARFIYVMNELKPQVTVYSHDAATGRMSAVQSVRTLPDNYTEETTGAGIALTPSGRFLYTTNRGHNSVQAFSVSQGGGAVERIQIISTDKTPRGFNMDPSGTFLLVAAQDSNTLQLYRIDSQTGKLSPSGQPAEVPSPVDVLFVPMS